MKYTTIFSSLSLVFSVLAFAMAFKFYSTHAIIIIPQTDGQFIAHDIDAERAKHDYEGRQHIATRN